MCGGLLSRNRPTTYGLISDHELNYLVTIYWPKEIRNFKQQIDILEGILGERHHVKK